MRFVAQARTEIAEALSALAAAQNDLLALKLERAVSAQRDVELEALGFCKSVNALHQRAAKWKAEQKRLRSALEVRQVLAVIQLRRLVAAAQPSLVS